MNKWQHLKPNKQIVEEQQYKEAQAVERVERQQDKVDQDATYKADVTLTMGRFLNQLKPNNSTFHTNASNIKIDPQMNPMVKIPLLHSSSTTNPSQQSPMMPTTTKICLSNYLFKMKLILLKLWKNPTTKISLLDSLSHPTSSQLYSTTAATR